MTPSTCFGDRLGQRHGSRRGFGAPIGSTCACCAGLWLAEQEAPGVHAHQGLRHILCANCQVGLVDGFKRHRDTLSSIMCPGKGQADCSVHRYNMRLLFQAQGQHRPRAWRANALCIHAWLTDTATGQGLQLRCANVGNVLSCFSNLRHVELWRFQRRQSGKQRWQIGAQISARI